MGNLVLIGGGRFEDTIPLLRDLVSLAGIPAPRIVILPTAAASGTGERRAFAIWQKIFEPLTTSIEPLYLLQDSQEREAMTERLQQADIVYLPGGDTKMTLKVWRQSGVDQILARVYKQGTILAGRSAGANAWCRCCIIAERPDKTSRFFGYRSVSGLGFLDIALSTHYSDRREPFRIFLQQFGGVGLGLDNDQALIIQNDRYRLHSLHGGAKVYKFTTVRSSSDTGMPFIVSAEEAISEDAEMKPLAELLRPNPHFSHA